MLPLGPVDFYEDRGRYPWNLSRFSSRCKSCSVQADAKRAMERRDAKSARSRERLLALRANRQSAGYFFSPQWLAIKAVKDETAGDRKIRTAWIKRQLNRLRGPYRDPIKALIRQRVEMYFKRRLSSSKWAQLIEQVSESPALSFDLEAIRAQHRTESARQAVERIE